MQTYLEPTQESGRAFVMRGMTGSDLVDFEVHRVIASEEAVERIGPLL
jgi:hypothetical protein